MPSGQNNREWKGQYCGVYEIAEYAGVTKAQVAHWLKEDWFPRPVDEPRMGRVWNYPAVVEALSAREYPKKEGRSGKKLGVRRRAVSVVVEIEDGSGGS